MIQNLIQREILIAKENYSNKVCNLLTKCKSQTDVWKTTKFFGLSKTNSIALQYPAPFSQTDLVYNNIDKVNLFNQIFTEISTLDDAVYHAKFTGFEYRTPSEFSVPVFEPFEVFAVLKRLKTNEACPISDIPNLLKKCFHSLATPLSHLFNRIVNEAEFPQIWKEAGVLPVYKKGEKAIPIIIDQYPCFLISQKFLRECFTLNLKLPNSMKTVFGHLETPDLKNIFPQLRYLLTSMTDYSAHAIKIRLLRSRKYISEAFNRVHHGGLLFKFRQLEIQGNCLKLLTSYLNNRTQYVSLCDVHSDKLHTNCGVPQGLIIGPLLFLIFANDIHDNIQSDIKLCADDISLLYSVHDATTTCKVLNEDLQQINIWAKMGY